MFDLQSGKELGLFSFVIQYSNYVHVETRKYSFTKKYQYHVDKACLRVCEMTHDIIINLD